jgi:putative spermidine/putrescine transport system permease protein
VIARARLDTWLLLVPALAVMALCFVFPLMRLFGLAFTDPAGPTASFQTILQSGVYRQVMWNTFVVSLLVTVICAVLAWPVAYVLSRLRGLWFAVVLYGVLFPLWISVLVRTFSWMLLLERGGPINRFLLSLGVIERPIALLFNDIGVIIGMVHVMLPYMILPLYGAMIRIDRRLLLASDGLGATLWDTFRRIYFPLVAPGLVGGATFVFLLSLGFFITPALLGGANAITLSMLIAAFVSERLAWELAAAASIILFVAVAIFLAVTAWLLPLNRSLFAR